MKLTISRGNMKLGNIPNLSFTPIRSCKPGCLCAKICYAMKSYLQFDCVRKSWDGNLALFTGDRHEFKRQLQEWLKKHKPRYFRYLVGGDAPTAKFFALIMDTAWKFPETRFMCYTKRWDLLGQYMNEDPNTVPPGNLNVLLSRWPGDIAPPESLRSQFVETWMLDPKNPDPRIPVGRHCPGSCKTCKLCWRAKNLPVLFTRH